MAFTKEQVIVAQTINHLGSGDPISDEDLELTIQALRPLTDQLRALGERYHLFWKELYHDLDTLEKYQDARKHLV
jgi:hypothetical protein